MTVFQVENRLFLVHRRLLAENPIYLSGVTVLEFETLFRYFYKSTGVSSFPTPVLSMYDGFSLPQSTWIALLSIAHPYEFLNVRVRAIREIYDPLRQWEEENSSSGSSSDSDSDSHLEPPDHLMLILTVGKYDMPLQKVLPSIVELVMREESLTEVEIAGLSTLAVYRLARARGVFTQDYERGVLGLP